MGNRCKSMPKGSEAAADAQGTSSSSKDEIINGLNEDQRYNGFSFFKC